MCTHTPFCTHTHKPFAVYLFLMHTYTQPFSHLVSSTDHRLAPLPLLLTFSSVSAFVLSLCPLLPLDTRFQAPPRIHLHLNLKREERRTSDVSPLTSPVLSLSLLSGSSSLTEYTRDLYLVPLPYLPCPPPFASVQFSVHCLLLTLHAVHCQSVKM